MVLLGRVKGRRGDDLGLDARQLAARQQGIAAALGGLALGFVLPVDAAAILAADVAELAVLHRRIDVAPEVVEQLPIADLLRVVGHANRLGVSGTAGADLFIGGIDGAAGGIAGFRGNDTRQFFEIGLDAPEATPGENRRADFRRPRVRRVGRAGTGAGAEEEQRQRGGEAAPDHARNSGSFSLRATNCRATPLLQ